MDELFQPYFATANIFNVPNCGVVKILALSTILLTEQDSEGGQFKKQGQRN